MARLTAIALALIMMVLVAWGLFFEAGATHIAVNGQDLAAPLKGTVGAAGLIVGLIALFCASIFMLFVFVFVFAGVGIYILSCVVLAGLVVAVFVFPFLLVLLLPLAILWAFIALLRGTADTKL
ncbi:MAG: hypothetical protein ABIS45_10740 [Burkholderiales bacterium]